MCNFEISSFNKLSYILLYISGVLYNLLTFFFKQQNLLRKHQGTIDFINININQKKKKISKPT